MVAKSKKVDTEAKSKKAKREGPKRPLTAYLFYSNERRPILSQKNPDLKLTEISKLIGDEWKQMNDGDRAPYMKMNQKDKDRYEREVAVAKTA